MSNFPDDVFDEIEDAEAPTQFPPTRILVVEDDQNTRTILHKRLKKNKYEVEMAEDGREGLEKALEFKPDIFLSDCMMPHMDGNELCKKIKSLPEFQSTFFIMLTARDGSADMIGSYECGVDEYLVKPCDPHELMARIRAAERVVRLQQSLEIKNAQLFEVNKRIQEEIKVTSQIQRDLLPQSLPEIDGYKFGAFYQPSTECSGDYYDLLPLSEDRFGIVLADVSGHGTPAMVAMALMRSLVHMFAGQAKTPADLLTLINARLFDHLPTTQFITCFYGVCERSTGKIQYSSAGQNPPLLVDYANNEACYLKNCEGFPLKLVSKDVRYENYEMQLSPSNALLLYTDGITEAANKDSDMFDMDRLKSAASDCKEFSPEAIIENVMTDVNAFIESAPFLDDVTMLLVNRS